MTGRRPILPDDDGDWSDETAQLDTTVIDDWSAGYVGVYRAGSVTAATQFDDFKVGIDANADLDFDDGGDEIAINDDFNSATISLTYDNNGNLTDDGIFKFVYDAWNRLVAAKHRSAANAATIGKYAYDGANRRVSKVVANQGVEVTPNDGGNTTAHFYCDLGWRIAEERNAANQAVRAYLGSSPKSGVQMSQRQSCFILLFCK